MTDSAVAEEFGIDPDTDEGREPEQDTQAEQDSVADEPTSNGLDSLPEWAQAEIRKARREAAKARVDAKAARSTALSEQERAIEAAKAEVAATYGKRLVAAELRGALTGVLKPEEVDDLIDDLNLSKFVDDEGEVDRDAVKALVRRLTGRRAARADVGHGANGDSPSRRKTPGEQFADALSGMLG